ncbi:hypothetical protein Csa_012496, partial [Cucumis sativus]
MRSCWMLHGSYLNDERRQNYTRTKRGLGWVWLQRTQRRLGRGYWWGHEIANLDDDPERHGGYRRMG